jgi:ParB/RepB/Spo0J family partition protein
MTQIEAPATRLQPVLTASLHPSPTNPRKTFAGDAWDAFVENVRAVGIMQPILVRPWPEGQPVSGMYALGVPLYEIVAGERRYRAAIACGLDMVPALIRDLSTAEVVRLQMVENLQREDLHPLEEAEGYALIVREHGFTADTLAAEIGKSRAYIYGRMKLLDARDEVKAAMRTGELAMSIGELIARIPSPALQTQAMNEVLRGEMTHRAASHHIQERYMLALKSAPFPREDANLVPAAGSCTACPKRTGNAQDLFADVSGTDVCTDPDCYRDKRVANMRREQAKAEAAGAKVVSGQEAKNILPYGADGHVVGTFAKASSRAYEMPLNGKGEYPKIGDIAKAAGVEPVLVADEDSGKLVKVYDTKAIKSAIKAEGGAAVLDHQDKQRQQDRERKAEQIFRRELYFQHIRPKIDADIDVSVSRKMDRWHLELVTAHMWGSLCFDGQKIIVDHVLDPNDGDAHSRVRAMTDGLRSMTDGQLIALQIDCAIVGTLSAPSYCDPKTPATLLDLATQWQVDARAVRKALQDAAKEKVKGTKKGSAKKVAADTHPTAATPEAAPQPHPLRVGDHCRIVLHRLDSPTNHDQNAIDHGVIITRQVSEPKADDTNSNTEGLYWARPAGPVTKELNARGFKVDSTPSEERCYIGRSLELWHPILCIGDRVRIVADAKGAGGKTRKCAGREGTVEEITGAYFVVRFAPGAQGVAANLRREELEKLPAPIAAAQAQEQIAPEKQVEAKPAKAWPFPRGPVSAPVEDVPDEAKPKLKAALPKSAAQAASSKAPKKKDQAATAARKKKSSGRASPAGGNEGAGATAGDDEGAIERCTRTIDMLDGRATCEQGASA